MKFDEQGWMCTKPDLDAMSESPAQLVGMFHIRAI